MALTGDDMGAGSSSLRQVTQLSVDGLKIDRSFVSWILDGDGDRVVVRMLIQLARAMDLVVTAEGIETVEQLQMVTDLGAGHAQGFLLGVPTPRVELPARARLAPAHQEAPVSAFAKTTETQRRSDSQQDRAPAHVVVGPRFPHGGASDRSFA